MKLIDLSGKVFGRLTVIERAENKGKKTCWRCKCACGNILIVQANHLQEGTVRSCGCLALESRTTHGLAHTKLYRAWVAIKQRCLNPKSSEYHNYGGRGITICNEWLEFQNFYNYVSTLEHYDDDGYTLDRIDVNGNYQVGNVRWIKREMQARNQRRNVYVDFYGVKMLLLDVAKITGINYGTLRNRIRSGWTGDELFSPVKKVMPKSDLVLIQNDEVYADSRKIAEYFEKRHDNVIRDIEEIIRQLNVETASDIETSKLRFLNFDKMFIKGDYEVEGQARKYPMYYLNRDGFMLLAMGFTGQKAFHFKLLFINEFNRMESALRGKFTPPKSDAKKSASVVQLCLPF